MEPGFEVKAGGIFCARIDAVGCVNGEPNNGQGSQAGQDVRDFLSAFARGTVSVSTDSATGQMSLHVSFDRDRDSQELGVRYVVEVSSDLRTWKPLEQAGAIEEIDNGDGTTTITVSSALFASTGGSAAFVRLNVTPAEHSGR